MDIGDEIDQEDLVRLTDAVIDHLSAVQHPLPMLGFEGSSWALRPDRDRETVHRTIFTIWGFLSLSEPKLRVTARRALGLPPEVDDVSAG